MMKYIPLKYESISITKYCHFFLYYYYINDKHLLACYLRFLLQVISENHASRLVTGLLPVNQIKSSIPQPAQRFSIQHHID